MSVSDNRQTPRPIAEGAERAALVRALARLLLEKEQEAERRKRARRLG